MACRTRGANRAGMGGGSERGGVRAVVAASEGSPKAGKSKTPALDSFGRDLTELARHQASSTR